MSIELAKDKIRVVLFYRITNGLIFVIISATPNHTAICEKGIDKSIVKLG